MHNRVVLSLIVLGAVSLADVSGADETLALGREVFLRQAQPACAVCHTLADAGSSGTIGPDLDKLAPDEDRIRRAVTSGVGVMPAFEGQLSDEQIAAVARYVAGVTRKQGGVD